jgi:hypothetical protein
MQVHHRGFRLQRGQCILASAVVGSATMVAVLIAAIMAAPESAFVSICAAGLAVMLGSAAVSQYCR